MIERGNGYQKDWNIVPDVDDDEREKHVFLWATGDDWKAVSSPLLDLSDENVQRNIDTAPFPFIVDGDVSNGVAGGHLYGAFDNIIEHMAQVIREEDCNLFEYLESMEQEDLWLSETVEERSL